MIRKTIRRLAVQRSYFARALALALLAGGTTATVSAQASAVSTHHFMTVQFIQPRLDGNLQVIGPRFDKAGHERLALTGTLTTTAGLVPMVVTRQLDEAVRIDLGGATPRSIIIAGLTNSPAATAGLAASDYSLLETVEDDTPENFFFGFQDGAAVRFLGSRFRTDDGTTAGYSGPFYDIYERRASVAAASGRAARRKLFYFDSDSLLLWKSSYVVQETGTAVEVVYSGWMSLSGLMVPGQIVRYENGTQTVSFTVQSAQLSALASDTVFNP